MNANKLKPEVESWVKSGIISAGQGEKILARYDGDVPAYKKMSFWLQCLAAVLVGLAFFMVISANWQSMGWLTQSLISALPLVAAHLWALWQEKRGNPLAAEIGWLLASLALGANIMLQAQIFHISAYYPNGVLFWVIGILPVIWLRASTVNFFLAALLFVVYLTMQWGHHQFSPVSVVPLLVIAIFAWSKQRVHTVLPLLTALYFFLLTILEKWQIPATGSLWDFSLILFAVALVQQFTQLREAALRRILIVLLACAAFLNMLLTFQFFVRHTRTYEFSPVSLVLIAISLAALLFRLREIRERQLTAVILANTLLSAGTLIVQGYLGAPEGDDAHYYFIRIAANLIYLGSVAALLFYAISVRAKGFFLSSVMAFLLWALIRYTDLFANYLITALIFVSSAVALVVANKLWEKKYEK